MTEGQGADNEGANIPDQQEKLRQDYKQGKISESDLDSKTDNLANKSFKSWEKNVKKVK